MKSRMIEFCSSQQSVVVDSKWDAEDHRGAYVHAELVRPALARGWEFRVQRIQYNENCSLEGTGSRICAPLRNHGEGVVGL